jgi:phosphomethylpyrimidine synthase
MSLLHKHAAEPSGARQIILRMTRRASRVASQQAISEEEALQRGMAKKSKEFVEKGAEVYTTA